MSATIIRCVISLVIPTMHQVTFHSCRDLMQDCSAENFWKVEVRRNLWCMTGHMYGILRDVVVPHLVSHVSRLYIRTPRLTCVLLNTLCWWCSYLFLMCRSLTCCSKWLQNEFTLKNGKGSGLFEYLILYKHWIFNVGPPMNYVLEYIIWNLI